MKKKGKVVSRRAGFVTVKTDDGQLLEDVAVYTPPNIDESVQNMNIKIGTQVMVEIDGDGQMELKGGCSHGQAAAPAEMNMYQIMSDLSKMVADLAQAVADTTPISGSSANAENKVKGDAEALKAVAMTIKGHFDSFM